MASLLGGLGTAKRSTLPLPTVAEDEVAIEEGKVDALEKKIAELEEELAVAKAQRAEVEAAREMWMDDPEGAFASLKSGEKRAYKSPDGYLDALSQKLDRLEKRESDLQNRIFATEQSRRSLVDSAASKKSKLPQRWKITGYIVGSKQVSGIRAFVYAMAALESGLAIVDEQTSSSQFHAVNDQDRKEIFKDCIWYEKDDLHFNILFIDEGSATRFTNLLSENQHIGENLRVTDALFLGSSHGLKSTTIRRLHYHSDDESSPPYTQILSSRVTIADPGEPIVKFQSIEHPSMLQLGYDLEKAHLVHDSELKRRRRAEEEGSREDSSNNRIVLTSALHKMFDGCRNRDGQTRIPLILIETVDSLPDSAPRAMIPESLYEEKRTRYRVWLKVSGYDEDVIHGVIGRMKPGCYVHIGKSGRKEIYTHVHVLDAEAFKANIRWKANETEAMWMVNMEKDELDY